MMPPLAALILGVFCTVALGGIWTTLIRISHLLQALLRETELMNMGVHRLADCWEDWDEDDDDPDPADDEPAPKQPAVVRLFGKKAA